MRRRYARADLNESLRARMARVAADAASARQHDRATTARPSMASVGTRPRPRVVETVAWAAGNGDRSENGDYIYGKRRLREIDRRIRFLTKRTESAEVVHPERQKTRDQVFFGATVTYANARGEEHTITIVGIDEADLAQHRVSWISPIARALLKSREGDVVELRTPAGRDSIEVIAIRYETGDQS